MQDPLSCHRHLLSTCDTAEGPTEGSGFADTAVAAAGVCPLPGPRSPQILPCVTTSWQAGQCRTPGMGPCCSRHLGAAGLPLAGNKRFSHGLSPQRDLAAPCREVWDSRSPETSWFSRVATDMACGPPRCPGAGRSHRKDHPGSMKAGSLCSHTQRLHLDWILPARGHLN